MYRFKDDYSELAHPRILQALLKAGLEQDEGYGHDRHCAAAQENIKKHLGAYADKVDIHFLCGGTQSNLTAISAFLRPHEAALATETAHICVHETGAIEATGHKVVTVPAYEGKPRPADLLEAVQAHHDEHMVKPRLLKISNSTELGTIYTRNELEALSAFCREKKLLLYVDGARLGAALTAPGNDISLEDMCRLTDAFYIGGTKNGAMLGEAMILRNDALKEDFRYHMKQKGGLLAKGRILGIQFEELFRDDLFFDLARHANRMAQRMAEALRQAGYGFLTASPTNQIFPILPNTLIARLERDRAFYVWQKMDEAHSAIRLVTSWATSEEEVDALIEVCCAGRETPRGIIPLRFPSPDPSLPEP